MFALVHEEVHIRTKQAWIFFLLCRFFFTLSPSLPLSLPLLFSLSIILDTTGSRRGRAWEKVQRMSSSWTGFDSHQWSCIIKNICQVCSCHACMVIVSSCHDYKLVRLLLCVIQLYLFFTYLLCFVIFVMFWQVAHLISAFIFTIEEKLYSV